MHDPCVVEASFKSTFVMRRKPPLPVGSGVEVGERGTGRYGVCNLVFKADLLCTMTGADVDQWLVPDVRSGLIDKDDARVEALGSMLDG